MIEKLIEFCNDNKFLILILLYLLYRLWPRKPVKMEEYPGHKVVSINSLDDWNRAAEEATNNQQLIVIDFYATWCGPCVRASPIYGKMSTEYDNVCFLKADVDKQRELMVAHNVRAMPTFVLLKDGQQVDSVVGFNEAQLRRAIEKHRGAAVTPSAQINSNTTGLNDGSCTGGSCSIQDKSKST